MAHFAKLDENSLVLEVNVVSNEIIDPSNEEASGIAFLTEWSNGHSNWVQTSYNTVGGVHSQGGTPLRKNYAGIGYIYDPVLDAFYAPQPFESWFLNEETCLWEAPVAYPTDGGIYTWNEATQSWDAVPSI